MNDNITILYEEAITEYTNLAIIWGVITGILLVVSIFMFLIASLFLRGKRKLPAVIIGTILLTISSISIGIIMNKPSYLCEVTGKYYYVTISGDVDLSEIYNNFNIVEQKGEIWILSTK